MAGVAVLGVDAQAVAQPLAVSPPGLSDLTHELFEDARIARDESRIEKACRRRPGATGVGGAFEQGSDAWLGANIVLPERVADGLGHPGRRELALVEEQQLDLGPRRQLTPAIGAQRHYGHGIRNGRKFRTEPLNAPIEAITSFTRGANPPKVTHPQARQYVIPGRIGRFAKEE